MSDPIAENLTDTDASVPLWDLPTRLFHWSVVALVVAGYITGEVLDGAMEWHLLTGYALLGLVLFRILWGLAGSRSARFADFLVGPRRVVEYAGTLFDRQSHYHAGHNPLGGWSVVLMLLLLLSQGVTGLFANDDVLTEGPLAGMVSKDISDLMTALHEVNFNLLLGLVLLHVGAVVFYRFWKNENLVAAMITGRKPRPLEGAPRPVRYRSNLLALLLLLAVSAGIVWGVIQLGG